MPTVRFEELPPVQRRRLVRRALLRALLTAGVLLAVYFTLPMDRTWGTATAVALAVGLVALAAVTLWQLQAITRAAYPAIRAIQVLAFVVPLYVLLFAASYFLLAQFSSASFSEVLTRSDALYFSVTVLATVGFGDIVARSEAARLVVTAQMLGDLALLVAGAQVVLGAVQRGQRRQAAEEGDASTVP